MNVLIKIDFNHPRVKKAYLNGRLSKSIITLLSVLGLLMIGLGVFGLLMGVKLSWLAFIAPCYIFMLAEWWRQELANVLPTHTSQKPEELLDYKILDNFVKSDNDLEDLIRVLEKQMGYRFMLNRLLGSSEIVKSCQLNVTPEDFWSKLINLWEQNYDEDGVDSAHICTALILNSSNAKELLVSANCSEQDILSVLRWYLYVKKTMRTLKERRNSGGIAKDWAAGYTPILNRFGRNLTSEVAYGSVLNRAQNLHKDIIDQMVSIYDSGGRANCALVGEVGVGKTTSVQGFAESLLFGDAPESIKYNQIFLVDTASILSSASAEKLDYIVTSLFLEAYKAKNIILFFPSAEQLFDSGKDKIDLSDTVLPIIQGGRVKTIFSFTPKSWQDLERRKPAAVAALNYQVVQPTTREETLLILENQSMFVEQHYNCLFTYKSLQEVYHLSERYGPDIAMPAKAIAVLESAGRQNPKSLITKELVQKSVEATTGVKLAIAGDEERAELLNLEEKIKQKIVGQTEAVKQVVTALIRSRAGVSNTNKPIGTFLFLGPTGVGKTELSKALARAYFGGEAKIVRVDMNEYITQESVHRLLASGGQTTPTFLDQMRINPFSVVLLDEIEKAHPDIKNVLLQMLDEGVMRDNDNHNISFKDAIIIATSNAGADYIRQNISEAHRNPSVAELTNKLIEDGIFKPEFLNRFDSTIIFSPLTFENLRQIVGIIISELNDKLSSQQLSVELSEGAVDWLAKNGYDAMLGARPLRRLIQQTVETAVSNKILANEVSSGDVIMLSENDLALLQ
ncbi:ATP-dependent Clp protease ATP-binding subunit [Candidatus Saccharibacteria bacterium]|mgnify:CR=1 FL=1|nr:ATP-dependent Clp protease ATP-binding subunit [Candidatus Saccharibacteria bacterium]HOR23261.1 AAA family ATPase [Candidatus Saccharibacteria bacterium]